MMPDTNILNRRLRERNFQPLRRRLLIGGLLVLAAAMLLLFSGLSERAGSGYVYLGLINANMVIIALVLIYVLRAIVVALLDRRGKLKNSNMHSQLIWIFGVLTTIPVVVVVGVSIYLFNNSLESWFSDKVDAAVNDGSYLAQSYVNLYENDFSKIIGLLVASNGEALRANTDLLGVQLADSETLLKQLSDRYNIDTLMLVDRDGVILASSALQGGVAGFDANLLAANPVNAFRSTDGARMFATARITDDLYLVAQNWLNLDVISKINRSDAVYAEYYDLKLERQYVKILVSVFFVLLAVVAFAVAVWAAIRLANRIVRPVSSLAYALNRIGAGDYDVRLALESNDEIGMLTSSFNRMSMQLQSNRLLLERKNAEIDERRKQMEAVLKCVTAGVVSLDAYGNVRWFNDHALRLFNLKVGSNIKAYSDELGEVYGGFIARPTLLKEEQLKVNDAGGHRRVLSARFVPQFVEGGKIGNAVVTLDDITPLISAQRTAAWRDAARRLAHEIKNPLTPIKLSAERLKRKYLSMIPEAEKELFGHLVDTVIRQAEDMRVMTNEFSDFARMPTARFAPYDINQLMENALLYVENNNGISFDIGRIEGDGPVYGWGDRSQLSQIINNLVTNSVNSIEERDVDAVAVRATGRGRDRREGSGAKSSTELQQGHIKVVVRMPHDDMFEIEVLDDGKGLPPDIDPEQLFEPYVTTREKGTGLGLAIIRRIVDDHGGDISLRRRPEGGTSALVRLPRRLDLVEHALTAQPERPDHGDTEYPSL